MANFDLSITGTASKWVARQPMFVSRPPPAPAKATFHRPGVEALGVLRGTHTGGYHPTTAMVYAPKAAGDGKTSLRYTNKIIGSTNDYVLNKHLIVSANHPKESREHSHKDQLKSKASSSNISSASNKVKPYRSTRTRKAPQGIPKLNLSGLCEPDEDMQPIQLIQTRKSTQSQPNNNIIYTQNHINDGSETVRSWGSPDTLRNEKKDSDTGKTEPQKVALISESKQATNGDTKKSRIVPRLDLTVLSSTRNSSVDVPSDIESIRSIKQSPPPNPRLTNKVTNAITIPKPKTMTAWEVTKTREEVPYVSMKSSDSFKEPHPTFLPVNELRKLDKMTAEVMDKEMEHPIRLADPDTSMASLSFTQFQNNSMLSPQRVMPRDLSKRLRFGARILTRKGRDSSRELCGFYFISDNTMTIYEFRQFGQRSSALPFIQRRPYRHLQGEMKDKPVRVGDLFTGLTLCFYTASQPSMPDSLKKTSHIYIRITHVDQKSWEEVKVYTEGLENKERRSKLASTDKSAVPIHNLFWKIMIARSPKSLISLGRYLLAMDTNDTGYLTKGQIVQCLKNFHINLSNQDFQTIWKLTGATETNVNVNHELFRRLLLGSMPEHRYTTFRSILTKLDANKTGEIHLWQMKKFFCAKRHPDVIDGSLHEDECYNNFFNSFTNERMKNPNSIAYSELEDYYEFISRETAKDSRFELVIKNSWNM